MPLYKFGPRDILRNRIKAYPNNRFVVNSASIYYNNRNNISGAHVENVTHVPSGHVSLYEMNIDRDFSAHTYDPDTNTGVKAKIFPFITKDSSLNSFATVSTNNFNQFQYGDIITGSYPFSASIMRETFDAGTDPEGSHLLALKNTLNYYQTTSTHYAFSSPGNWDKSEQEVTLISIPSIFYGSSIKQNSIKLDFFISGTLVASCEDLYRNGELIQTSGTDYAQGNGSGSVAGVALYNEGFVLLTGSWDLTEQSFDFGVGTHVGTWKDFAAGANDGLSPTDLTPSASFALNFKGTNFINTVTMMCDAPKGELFFSPNPTFTTSQVGLNVTSSEEGYFQNSTTPIKNTVSSSFHNYEEDYKPQTFISKIGIYDERRNLIAIANLAKPVKKMEDRDFTFKLKLDI